MKNKIISSLLYSALLFPSQVLMSAEVTPKNTPSSVVKTTPIAVQKSAFEPFTGKISRNKVRLRLLPTFDSVVLKEVNRNDMIIVLGETDDFYDVQPPKDTKGYVFRTFVLDNVVEGTKVNVRLKPDLEAPIVGQLYSGDRVDGVVDAANNKWLQIPIPETARFYIAKEYVDKVGDIGLLTRLEKRRDEVDRFLNTTFAISETEMRKPFDQVNIDSMVSNYKKVIHDYTDLPEVTSRANSLLASLQDNYTAKKIAFLESQTTLSSNHLEAKNKTLSEKLQAYQEKLTYLEQQLQKKPSNQQNDIANTVQNQLPLNMSTWIPIEQSIFTKWSGENLNNDMDAFYTEQKNAAFTLSGLIEPYNRPVKNKPGDYMLVNAHSKLPVAFLYSTQINLQDFVGHEIKVTVSPRPNNQYAFPAYFVLTAE